VYPSARFILGIVFWLATSQCVHAGAPNGLSNVAHSDDTILQKFDPALRLRLADKSEESITALVETDTAWSQQQIDRVAGWGIEILSVRATTLHVRGTPGSLYQLASLPSVKRVRASRSLRP
jgi:hypothetical protein